MRATSLLSKPLCVFATLLLLAVASWAQFTGNIQGIVQDPSRAAIAGAKLVLVNTATQVSTTTTSDDSGNYRFLSLAPGSYKITAEAAGFTKAESDIILQTN